MACHPLVSLKSHRTSHDHDHDHAPQGASAQSLAWAFQFCHDKGVRKTRARDALIHCLLELGPISWRGLSESSPLSEICNPSTVFRLLVRLEEIGLVRRITVRGKPPFFTIGLPGDQHNDYVVCTECASIQNLHILCPGNRLEKQLEEEFGFRGVHHEFVFYGTCKACVGA
ncbi:MAG TPA: transcriptional repressor [Chthoniobacteraceae bacterium]|nr:transcriptional repressor [Chthoniobacteraceae bacterium]